jgi:hypothetical protein
MPEAHSSEPSPNPASNPKLAEIVRLAILQAAELRALADRAKEIADRVSKITPPPEPPEAEK